MSKIDWSDSEKQPNITEKLIEDSCKSNDWAAILDLRDDMLRNSRGLCNNKPDLISDLNQKLYLASQKIEFLEWQNSELQAIIKELSKTK